MTKIVTLLDRAVIFVSGSEAKNFLQNIITNDLERLNKMPVIMAALLTPQGKISYEFFILEHDDGFLLETARGGLDELFKKLNLYKLRADVQIEDWSLSHMVVWLDGQDDRGGVHGRLYKDPRHEQMGWRGIVSVEAMAAFSEGHEPGSMDDYLAHRLMVGMPEGGYDYAFGDIFPHEAGLDILEAIDFQKGCYVGQEIVSRMEHRSTVRKRIVIVEGAKSLPLPGTEIRTTQSLIGVLGSGLGNKGLALVRLDRAGRAIRDGDEMRSEGVPVTLSIPPWAAYKFPVNDTVRGGD